jgi:hypothetical protein
MLIDSCLWVNRSIMIKIIKSSKILIIRDFDHQRFRSSKFWSSKCFIVRSTHSVILNSMILMSISLIKTLQNFDFVIAFAKLMSSSIHLISTISLLSYNCRKHIKSIINRFSAIVSSLIKQSNKLLKFVNNINDKKICSIRSMIDLIIASTSKSLIIIYSSTVNTILMIRLHLIDDQCIRLAWMSNTYYVIDLIVKIDCICKRSINKDHQF